MHGNLLRPLLELIEKEEEEAKDEKKNKTKQKTKNKTSRVRGIHCP